MADETEEFGGFIWADIENGAGPNGAMLPPPKRPDPVPCEIIRPVFGKSGLTVRHLNPAPVAPLSTARLALARS
jgi:hypothetical protein